MALIVQKYGGSSVADAEKIQNVCRIIARTYDAGNDVVVVLSAQGDTTDELIEKARAINPKGSKREMDMLLNTGEQISISLAAMCLEGMGYPAISLSGWQAGIHTNSDHSAARIRRVENERIREELDKHRIVLVAGFQGLNRHGDVTTLGRGGSDTTAVALAVSLKADLCQIYTDVDGIYTTDPRIVPTAKKLKAITHDEMMELASLGAQVLHNRCIELAKHYHVRLEVLSSFSGEPGTIVKEVVKVEKTYIRGVAQDKKIARVAVMGLDNVPGVAYHLFSLMAKANINVDLILQSIGRHDAKDISFTIADKDMDLCRRILEENREELGYSTMNIANDVAKISIVGCGMADNPGVAATMFEALSTNNINIRMISTSEIKISVLIAKEDSERAIRAIHDKFFD